MLIEFRVSNFKSFLEEQTLSMVANNYEKEHAEHLIDPQIKGMKRVKLLRGAALYGANASGKSNLLQALVAFGRMLIPSSNRDPLGDLYDFLQSISAAGLPTERGFATFVGSKPFKLAQSLPNGGRSSFHVKFVVNKNLFDFRVELDRNRVLLERLCALDGSKAIVWYERRFDVESDTYSWNYPSKSFSRDAVLESKTRHDVLFLSVGYTLNHPQLTPVHDWFSSIQSWSNLRWIDDLAAQKTVELMMGQRIARDEVLQLTTGADFGVSGLELVEAPTSSLRSLTSMWRSYPSPGEEGSPAALPDSWRMQLMHHGVNGTVHPLGFAEESEGTRRFLSLAGPLLHARGSGGLIVVDEIETSLHPHLVTELLKILLQPGKDAPPAQIIFTTHNPYILSGGLLRRDQVWFTEKDREGKSHLYPLSDFKARKGEALSKGYLAGRYGGIPFIPEGLLP